MADEKVKISDVIVPDIFEDYVIERTAELARFVQAGLVAPDAEFDELAQGGGRTVNMPFWKDLTGDRQILSDSANMETRKITTDKDIARLHNDGNAWSSNVLSKWLSGDDPMGAIATLVAEYWMRQDEKMLVSSLKGVFAAASMSGNLLAIHSESIAGQSSATKLNGETFIDGLAKLGDRSEQIIAVAMHSTTEFALRKLDLIDFIPDSEGKGQITTFQGRRVVTDDDLPTRAGTTDGTVYTTFLFGMSAIGKGSARLTDPLEGGFGTEGVEFARVPLASDSQLINRRRHILHPRGVKWTDASVAGASPTNAELATAANWTRVYENKNVRIIAITHN